MATEEQIVDYFVIIDGPGGDSPSLYFRLPAANQVSTVRAVQEAGFEILGFYEATKEGPKRIGAKLHWRRPEGELSGKPLYIFGSSIHKYYFQNADWDQAIEALTSKGLVRLDRLSDLDRS